MYRNQFLKSLCLLVPVNLQNSSTDFAKVLLVSKIFKGVEQNMIELSADC